MDVKRRPWFSCQGCAAPPKAACPWDEVLVGVVHDQREWPVNPRLIFGERSALIGKTILIVGVPGEAVKASGGGDRGNAVRRFQ